MAGGRGGAGLGADGLRGAAAMTKEDQTMTDIVERLEAEAKLPGADKWLLQDAATEIEHLNEQCDIFVREINAKAIEIEQLTAEIRDGKSQSKTAIRELRAEVERLRALLHEAWAVIPPCPFREQLRRALEPKP